MKLQLLFTEILMFASVLLASSFVAYKYYSQEVIEQMSVSYAVPYFLITFAVAVVMIILILKFVKSPIIFKILFSVTILMGTALVANAFLAEIPSVVMGAAAVALYWIAKNILIHNLLLMVCVTGVAVYFGLTLPPVALLILLGVLSIYDIIAVFGTKHMITMFKGLASSGATFGLIIPETLKSATAKVSSINLKQKASKRGFILLGTGDLAFPAMLAVSVQNLTASYYIIGGAILGVVAVHFLLIKLDRPLPALPPIAIGSALGYLVALI